MGLSGMGVQTVYPFHVDCIQHYTKHGFAYMGMKTIVTDVVRENNQTYRLGWSEQCKDGTKMGVGMPEYLLLFRKPATDRTNAYADEPVVKSKSDYTRAKWQIDAHGFTRSSGNRCLKPEELAKLPHDSIFQEYKRFSLETVYNHDFNVKIAETLDLHGKLPTSFMLLQPQSWSDEVWTDVTRMLTLNGSQWSKGKEMHLCPMQFDIADRVIEQMSNKGDVVLDPFGGLMTVPYRAVLKGRYGVGFELNPQYFLDGAAYCEAAAQKVSMPTLFDLIDEAEAAQKQAI
jgi:DNA methylase N-4/N-6 domain protein